MPTATFVIVPLILSYPRLTTTYCLSTMLRYAATANKRHIAAAVGVSGGAVTFYALSSAPSEDELLDAVPHDSQPEPLASGVPHPFVSQLLGGGRSSTSVALTEGTRPAFTVSPRLTRHPFISKELSSREEQLARLAGDEEFDVLVVGGGATGSGVALDAQMRGLNTALIERADFSSETSSRSTKLVSLRVGICARMAHGPASWDSTLIDIFVFPTHLCFCRSGPVFGTLLRQLRSC